VAPALVNNVVLAAVVVAEDEPAHYSGILPPQQVDGSQFTASRRLVLPVPIDHAEAQDLPDIRVKIGADVAKQILDSDGIEVKSGCTIHFGYGIPGRGVDAPVIERNGKLIALTAGHKPSECPVSELKRHVGDFWVKR
jgi:hypothetical protein